LASVAIGLIACVQHALSSHTPVSNAFAAVSGVLMLVDLLELDGAEMGRARQNAASALLYLVMVDGEVYGRGM
jgi:hypothetical protein